MSFSEDIRTRTLVASARHCCVCHRYKGVKVEVHHIIPEPKGLNDFDNAIVLCFDCHCDAGHYNTKHPRGSKLSPDELRKARDAWYNSVRDNNITSYDYGDYLYCRYLICQDFAILKEISERKFDVFPLKDVLLLDNLVSNFQRKIISLYPVECRSEILVGEEYRNEGEFRSVHPDLLSVKKESPNFPYFDFVRVPNQQEFEEKIKDKDRITEILFNNDIPIEDIVCSVGSREEGCGDYDCFQEVYRLRPLWGIFLAVTNITDTLIVFNTLECIAVGDSFKDYRLFDREGKAPLTKIPLPKVHIPPRTTVLIPTATVLVPLHHISFQAYSSHNMKDIGDGEVRELSHGFFEMESYELFHAWGPTVYPNKISLSSPQYSGVQEVHTLDLGNVYIIDQFWTIGCCPHLFFKKGDNAIFYSHELFNRHPGVIEVKEIVIPMGVENILIVELEDETTFIEEITLLGKRVVHNITLLKGDIIKINVQPNEKLRIIGKYLPNRYKMKIPKDSWYKNELIGNFIRSV